MIAAIETRYAGCRFRSRLEARWAVFFDMLRIKWEYEPEGFSIPRRDGTTAAYLPDFWSPSLGCYVEVKGDESRLDVGLLEDAAQSLGYPLLLLGPIPNPLDRYDFGWTLFERSSYGEANYDRVGVGPYCCANVLVRYGWYQPGCERWLDPVLVEDWEDSPGALGLPTPEVLIAYRAARSARFEHGEFGPPLVDIEACNRRLELVDQIKAGRDRAEQSRRFMPCNP